MPYLHYLSIQNSFLISMYFHAYLYYHFGFFPNFKFFAISF